jgi:hypothetical protein
MDSLFYSFECTSSGPIGDFYFEHSQMYFRSFEKIEKYVYVVYVGNDVYTLTVHSLSLKYVTTLVSMNKVHAYSKIFKKKSNKILIILYIISIVGFLLRNTF